MLKKLLAISAFTAPTPFQRSADGTLPTRLLIAKWGRMETNKGPVVVDESTVRELPRFQTEKKFDRIALDFQHNTLRGVEPCKVAAYGVPEVVPNEGLYLTGIEWTPEGKEHAEGGHYPDLSPAVYRDPAGRVFGLHSVALCRQGEIDGITLFNADPNSPTTSMDLKALLIECLTAFGVEIPESPSDDQITAAVAAMKEKKPAKSEEKPAEMSPDLKKLDERLTKFETDREQAQRDALVAEASRDGKVIPLSAEEIKSTPLPILTSLVKNLKPGEVPLKSGVAGAKGEPDAMSAKTLTDEDKFVAKTLGLKLETFAAAR